MAKKRDVYRIGKEKVPSVTKITGILHKPALVPWAAKCVVEHIMSRPQESDGGGWFVDEDMLLESKNAHRKKLTEAGDFGSNIHSLVGAYVEGQLSLDILEDEKDRKALENFMIVTEGWEWLGSEIVVYEDELFYGGTADAIARLPDGKTVIVDFKTSSGVYPEHGLQIAMYAYAEPSDKNLSAAWSEISEGRILHFDKERLTWESLERDIISHYDYIPHFCKVYEWINETN